MERFNYVKKGYDPIEVETYISKLKNNLENYQQNDDSIQRAFVGAQIAADSIVKNAEIEALNIKRRAAILLNEISNSLDNQRQMFKDFQKDYNNMLSKYLHKFNDNDIALIYSKMDELENYISSLQKTKSKDKVLLEIKINEIDEIEKNQKNKEIEDNISL